MSVGSHHTSAPSPPVAPSQSNSQGPSQQPAGPGVSESPQRPLTPSPVPSPGIGQSSAAILVFAVHPHAERVPALGLRTCMLALCPGHSSQAGATSPRVGECPSAPLHFLSPDPTLVSLGTHSLPPDIMLSPQARSSPLPDKAECACLFVPLCVPT